MRSRNIIHAVSLAVIIAGIFLVLQAATPAKKEPCKESMDQCCKKKGSDESNNLIWETLPHQFFSSISFD